MTGTLFLVGTPIGNLEDMTDRARSTLATVDIVAAEDTRRTGRLLAHFEIGADKLVSFFDGNEAKRSAELVEELESGKDVAVVTDAGMPGISDPGERLVRAAADAGVDVRVVPGPSAALSALVLSGFPGARFVFEGFLPRRASERRARLDALARDPRTVVLFESPKRTAATTEEIAVTFGADRRIAVAREITKLHEEVLRGSASEIAADLATRDLKGEVVIVVEGAPADAPLPVGELADEAAGLVAGGMRKRAAAAEVGRRYGSPANAIYEALVLGERSG